MGMIQKQGNWVLYQFPKRRKSRGIPGHVSTSTARPNIHGAKVMLCIWWDQLVVVYYEHWRRNGHSTKKDMTKLCSSMTMFGHKSQDRSRHIWKRWNGRSYPSRRTLQKLLLPTNICFDRWHTAWLISISALMEKSKNRSIRGSPQKTHHFFEMVSDNCQKDGKKSV